MITVVDYGLGNVHAFARIFKDLNIPVTIARDAAGLRGARKVVLPGVGAFDWAMEKLTASGMREPLDGMVRGQQCDVIGICIGMQILADRSDEGEQPGLGWIRGDVKLFEVGTASPATRLPHMGWNDVTHTTDDRLFHGMNDARFYFLHSYHLVPVDNHDVLATADYGGRFVCGIRRRNIFGVQFHPEKSHHWGVQLLRNFAEL